MRIVDLSHVLEAQMPLFPGTQPPRFADSARIDTDGYREKRITLSVHTGTHLDVPAHILASGETLDQLPVETFCGSAFLLDRSRASDGPIQPTDLTAHETAILESDYLILNTGWSRYWGDARYFSDFPVLSLPAADWLAHAGLKGVGMDTLSADLLDAPGLPVHHRLLAAGMVIVENLTNLAAIPAGRFLFSCLPLNIKNGDGSPVRAVAMLP
ncbi:Cyclase family protein [Desulfosarcina cetonica]|uniref:cyclase family protein n=1 Tax=Desulfosarcina cetonica TaxID=90730 RepID=UPI0006D07FF0|nr:cyclase family protein [Desulfosarcina cetonica]VTR67212.1 Cyclase family protein [Desulfosarcina cetonica]